MSSAHHITRLIRTSHRLTHAHARLTTHIPYTCTHRHAFTTMRHTPPSHAEAAAALAAAVAADAASTSTSTSASTVAPSTPAVPITPAADALSTPVPPRTERPRYYGLTRRTWLLLAACTSASLVMLTTDNSIRAYVYGTYIDPVYAFWYNRVHAERKRVLLQSVNGRVLELGVGTGEHTCDG